MAFLAVCPLIWRFLDSGQPGKGRCRMLQIQCDSYRNGNCYTCIMLQLTRMTWYCYDEELSYHVMISCTWNVSWHPSQGPPRLEVPPDWMDNPFCLLASPEFGFVRKDCSCASAAYNLFHDLVAEVVIVPRWRVHPLPYRVWD